MSKVGSSVLLPLAGRPGRKSTAKFRISPIAYSRVLFNVADEEEARFTEEMKRRLGADLSVIPLGRARAGLYLLVKYAMQSGRRKVLLSPFTIPDVVNMVVFAGGEPVFFDSKPNSTLCDVDALGAMVDNETACVIATHYHVNETGLGLIAQHCKRVGALLFDDCAISYGGKIDGKPIGGLTDGSVFSLSAFKMLNFFWGGMITTRDEKIAAWVRDVVSSWPRLDLNAYARQAGKCIKYDLATRPAIFRLVVFPILRKRAERQAASLEWMNRIESESLDASLTSRPHVSAFAEWNRKIFRGDEWLKGRQDIARIYHRRLGQFMISAPISEAQFDESCFCFYPVTVPPGSRDEIQRRMILGGFDAGLNLYPNVHYNPKFAAASGKWENVDRMIASSIHLPTHFGVSASYAEASAAALATLLRS